MDIVIRSPNWIGDCIMCLPAIRILKITFPGAKIFIVARQSICAIYQNINEINEIIPIPEKINFISNFKTAKRLKEYRFDYSILFTNSFHSAFLFKLAGIKKLFGYAKDLRGWLLYKKIKFPRNNRHHIHFYLDLAEVFIEEKSGEKIKNKNRIESNNSNQMVITGNEREKVSADLQNLGIDFSGYLLGISPSAAYGSAKEWLPERFRELILRLRQEKSLAPVEILLFGSAKEREKISKIADVGEGVRIHNLAGRLSLRDAATAISFCSLFISNDSGLMHIASSFDIPLVALFGPTQPHKTGPLNKNARVLYHPVECAPCQYRDCPLKYANHSCMKAITVDEVLEIFHKIIPPGSTPSFPASNIPK